MTGTRTPSSLDRRSALGMLGQAGALLLLGPSCGWAAQPAEGAGILSDGRSDDAAALQAAIDALVRRGGGELSLRARAVTRARAGPVVGENVSLNLNGGTLLLELSDTNATGVRLRSGATVRNGTITVRSSGRPSLQGAAHAPVVVGPLYGEGSDPGRPSPDEGVSGWAIRDLTLSSDKDVDDGAGSRSGAAAISIRGGVHDGLIENIQIPDNAVMLGGIHMDWSTVGPIDSFAVPQDAEHYRQGRGYTTHPHDIVVRNIRIGRLSRPHGPTIGSYGVRLAGVYNISVSDVAIEQVTGTAFCHHAGDLGFEFAPASVKPMACRGIRFLRGTVRDGSTACLIWTDSYADNVGRETLRGYRPMLEPIHPTDILFERIEGVTGGGRGANYGIRVDRQTGGRIVDCIARGYRRGFYVDELVDGLTLVRPVALDNAEDGISVEHPSRPPRNIVVENPVARGNGRSAVLVGRSDNVRVDGGTAPVHITRDARGARATGSATRLLSRD
jgi:hypothetical protein